MEQKTEIWKPIKVYEGRYEVSNEGKVASICRGYRKILSGGYDDKGYRTICLTKNGTARRFGVHRLVALHFCEGYKEGLVVNHKDQDPMNNHADNLEWATRSYNFYYNGTHDHAVHKKMQTCTKNLSYNEDNIKRLGEILWGLRKEAHLSRLRLQEKTGVDQSVICAFEHGYYNIQIKMLSALLKVFGKSLDVM